MKLQNNTEAQISGSIGLLTWKLINNTLIISGKGAVLDYKSSRSWQAYKNHIATVIIENGIKSIMQGTFSSYTNLTTINIPKTVRNIEEEAFGYEENVKAINVDSNNPVYSSENGVLFDKAKTVLISCSVDKMRDYIIPDSVTSIGDYAFIACKLYSITIPSGLISIGQGAFCRCKNLKHIILHSKTPPIINEIMYKNTFKEVDKDTCILHIPFGSKNRYANAEDWKEFKNIQEDTE